MQKTRPNHPLDSDVLPVGQTVSSLSAGAMLSGIRAAGIDVAPLLRSSGIAPGMLDDRSGRITLRQWARLFQAAALATDDEALGLLERPMAIGTFLMISRAFIHCKTIGEGMVRFVHFYNLLRTGLTYEFVVVRRTALFTCRIDHPKAVKHNVLADFSLVSFHRLFSWLANEMILLDSVTIAGPPADYVAEYATAFFNTPIQHEQRHHTIAFSKGFMDLPIVRSEKDLEDYLTKFSTAMFLPLPMFGELSRRLQAYMLDQYERFSRLPDLSEAASYLAVHPRRLFRLLHDEGLSFREMKTRIRRDIAIRCLTSTGDSIETIAELTGFSEPSAFIRAFRTWTGKTPLSYRKSVSSDRTL